MVPRPKLTMEPKLSPRLRLCSRPSPNPNLSVALRVILRREISSSSVLLKLPVPVSASKPFRSNGGSSFLYPASALSLSISAPSSGELCSGLKLNGGARLLRQRRPFLCNSQLADLAPATSAVYGALLLGGGLFAFSKSGSKGSLAGGLTGAALMAATYYLLQARETKASGDALGFGSAFLFSAVFGIRLAATGKPVPAGPLLGLSLSALVIFISAYLQQNV